MNHFDAYLPRVRYPPRPSSRFPFGHEQSSFQYNNLTFEVFG